MKDNFIKALKTLLWSWGSDTPSEAIWAANELLDYWEQLHNIKCHHRFLELEELLQPGNSNMNELAIEWLENN